jgi:sulfur relay (sulfurtransferase) complex TusBCD TusD component (DsrE family)
MSLVYLISSDKIGNQDPELGQKLMRNFLLKLLEASEKPTHILLVERGVQLLQPEFLVTDALKVLEKEYDVEIMACMTCLDYYGIKDKIEVGQIVGMIDIINIMHGSDKVINL